MSKCKKHTNCISDKAYPYFRLTCKQRDAEEKFRTEQDKIVAKMQNREYAYYGASGGGYTYSFSPCGIGTCVKVKNDITKNEVDISFYEDW